MVTSTNPTPESWSNFLTSKDLYFRGGWSLCSKVPYLSGKTLEKVLTGDVAGPNDCAICWRKKHKEEEGK